MAPDALVALEEARAARAPEAFRRYQDGLIHRWMGSLLVLGFTLLPASIVLDVVAVGREHLLRLAFYRAAATAYCLVAWAIHRRQEPGRKSYVHGYAAAAVVSTLIVLMTVELGGFESNYYAGLNLVIVAVNLLLPWRPVHAALNGAMIVAIYAGLNAAFGGPWAPHVLVANVYFMVATVVIAVALTHLRVELLRKEYDARSELLDANAMLDVSRREARAARDALWGEMEVAKRIQTALLPADRRMGEYEVAAVMFPAAEVGGDYYDLIALPDGRRWIAVGDASGHGVESGLVMMMAQTSILSTVRQDPALGPSGVFQAVNGVLCENVARLGGDRYMTLNVVRLDDGGLTLAGKHQDLLVWRAGEGRVETVTNAGCWAGVLPDAAPFSPEAFVPLAPGDFALFFTDGVTEARDGRGELYGQERLTAAVARAGALPPAEAIRAVLRDVAGFITEQDDDMTMLVVRRAPASPAPSP